MTAASDLSSRSSGDSNYVSPGDHGSGRTSSPPSSGLRRLLVVTKIFPNSAEPEFAPYNVKQVRAIRARGVDVDVIAPVPWFPLARRIGGASRAAVTYDLPARERVFGIDVEHPRILHVPKLYGATAPAYAASLLPWLLPRRGRYDALLSCYAYPDGVAAVMLGFALGLPVVVKVHGGDLNQVGKLPGPRRHLKWAMPRVDRLIAVSEPLADEAASIGLSRDRIDVVLNGVDRQLFAPRDRRASRSELNRPADRALLLYVGRLERRKGVFELMEAFAELAKSRPDVDLVLVGGGDDTEAIRKLADPISSRVVFAGKQDAEGVARWLGAADLLVLPSHAEGTPNVVIEALTAGRRVVATDVGGTAQVVSDPSLGELIPPRDVDALRAALDRQLRVSYDPKVVAARGGRGDWQDSGDRLLASIERAISEHASRRHQG